ncbi:MAG: hypothetical protein CVV57_00135 [Tenericutes bacterium HGW-Tenericutes-2]|jgi:hypothetical protein|nr:MAG: hypothetical protein CVV57_00135 [Tenericutes bacterium HGW-Tenericutes-2]
MNKRGLVIGLLVMLAVITSGFTYAFWANSVEGGTSTVGGSIVIGEGKDVTTTFVVTNEDNNTLLPMVPTGYQVALESTNVVVLNFTVEWDAEQAGADGVQSTLTLSALTFGGVAGFSEQTEYTALFSAVVTGGLTHTITEGVPLELEVTVTFYAEPANQGIYEDVANATLTLDITFTVAEILVP